MRRERVEQILKHKKESNDFTHKYIITPSENDIGCDIIESRFKTEFEDVISSDKKVITMSHLGYDYLPFSVSYGEDNLPDNFSELFELGIELSKKYIVWLVDIW